MRATRTNHSNRFEIIFFFLIFKKRWSGEEKIRCSFHMIIDGWSVDRSHIQLSTRFAYDSVAWFNAFIFLYRAVIVQFVHSDQRSHSKNNFFSLSSIFIHYQVSYGQDRAVVFSVHCDQNELYIFSFIDTLWKIDHHHQRINPINASNAIELLLHSNWRTLI